MESKFKIGDKVLIVQNSHRDLKEEDGIIYDYFNEYVGKLTTITGYNGVNVDDVPCYYTDISFPRNSDGNLSVCEEDIEHI